MKNMNANFNYNNIEGWFDPNFAAIYEDRVNSVNSNDLQIFVEVGSWFGKSTAFMGEMIKRSIFRSNIKFYAVDTLGGLT